MALLTAVFVGSCRGHPNAPTDALTFAFDFRGGPQGFVAGFADYPPADADIYELTADYRALPPPLASQSALFISGVNRSDDLFMFFKGPIAGLSPGGRYIVTGSVEIATDTPAGCFGGGWRAGRKRLDQGGCDRHRTARYSRRLLPAHEHRHRQSVRRRGTRRGAPATSPTPEAASRRVSGSVRPSRADQRRHRSLYLPVAGPGCCSAPTRDSRPGRPSTSPGRRSPSRRCDRRQRDGRSGVTSTRRDDGAIRRLRRTVTSGGRSVSARAQDAASRLKHGLDAFLTRPQDRAHGLEARHREGRGSLSSVFRNRARQAGRL